MMGRVLKIGLVLLVVVVAAVGYYLWRAMPRIPERPFTAQLGPHPVGTREFDWTDSSRAEPFTKAEGDRRRVVVQVWYPTIAGAPGDTARYLIRPSEFADQAGARMAKKARTNSILEAPVAAADSGFPVLIYNHGGLWTRWSATFVTEWLASQGYVVFSIEHFGFNQTVAYPDGTPYTADTLTFPKETGDGKADARASWAYLDDPVFKVWEADAHSVLDRIEALNAGPGPFAGRLDLTRVGAFGWSFGGALAVQLSATDPRVKVAVDHDGQLFGTVKETGTTRPVLQFHHGLDDALDYPEKDRAMVHELMAETEVADSTARARSTADWFAVTIAGTQHGDFSDLALFYPRTKVQLDPRRGHEIIRAYTLAFFDAYLRGKPSPLLESPSPFAEASVQRWPGPVRGGGGVR